MVRFAINTTVEGVVSSARQLTVFWSLALTLWAPFLLVTMHVWEVFGSSENYLSELPHATLCLSLTGGCIIIPIALGALFPKLFDALRPTEAYQWSFHKAPRKYKGPEYAVRRIPVACWDEFLPIPSLWKKASTLRFTRLQPW